MPESVLRRGPSGLWAQDPGLDAALALDLDEPAGLEGVAILQLLEHRPRHLDGVRDAGRLHPAGQVHRVAPEIVDELAAADNARDDGAAVDADPKLQRDPQ